LKIVWILSIFTILGDGSPKMKQWCLAELSNLHWYKFWIW
jgi:hypothetical protein